MNVTNLINAISRELDKETKKEADRRKAFLDDGSLFTFSSADVRNLFDRAALTVATREFDKFRKEGAKKV